MNHDVDLAGAAALLHRSTDWMQRRWRDLVATEAFPRPFVGEVKGGRPWWRIDDIEAWKARQSTGAPASAEAQHEPDSAGGPAPANDPVPVRRRTGRVAALLAAAGC